MTISRNTFDPAKSYKRVRFHEDRDLLDSELNEVQEIHLHDRQLLWDRIFTPGSILSGLTGTVNGTQVVFTVGIVYLDGHPVRVPGATLAFPDPGVHTIYVDVFRRETTVVDDPDLVNPLTGEPTAEREKWLASLQTRDTSGDPLPEGATGRTVVPVYTFDREAGTLTPVVAHIIHPGNAAQLADHLGHGGLDRHPAATATEAGFQSAADKVKLDGLSALPPGMILPYAGSLVPAGWRECNGDTLDRSAYAALFAAIGTVYGAGDGTTTFQLPDLRGEFVRGWDHGRGVDGDRTLGSAQGDSLASHTHPIVGDTSGGDDPWGGIERKICTDNGGVAEGTESGTLVHLSAGANGTDVETRPRNVAMWYLIKT